MNNQKPPITFNQRSKAKGNPTPKKLKDHQVPTSEVQYHDFKELQDKHRPALNKVLNDILKDLGL